MRTRYAPTFAGHFAPRSLKRIHYKLSALLMPTMLCWPNGPGIRLSIFWRRRSGGPA
ncbi:hypothetical protein KCP70_17970 [Salmonella enterica subsp. enterica]|nr:hypothetical protein KCP70_17970 [Salmonella enterica subsp. enterica]